MNPIIQAAGLVKRFGAKTVVNGIDFEIRSGQCFGFLGPNGAGKTTTLRMLLGLSPMTEGRLEVFGLSMPAQAKKARACIGVVPQEDNLDPDFSVVENLYVYGSFFDIPRGVLAERVDQLLDFMELNDRANDKPNALSGGMRRRLTFARALINDPELIVLDEPTTGLDPQVRHLIWSRLRNLLQKGKTLLLTTHYMDEAERMCDELVIMDHGKILDQGSPQAIIECHIEKDVLEIRNHKRELLDELTAVRDCRIDVHGDTVFCYSNDADTLLDKIKPYGCIVRLQRRANLEDVFLKLTGHELRE